MTNLLSLSSLGSKNKREDIRTTRISRALNTRCKDVGWLGKLAFGNTATYVLSFSSLTCAFTPNINYSETGSQQCNTLSSGTSHTCYITMSNALAASGRDIYHEMCNWGQDSVWTRGLKTANSWRVSSDVTNKWSSIVSITSGAQVYSSYAGPGGFNDFDILEVMNGGLTAAQERAHFGILALAKSPLLIGTDLMKISKTSLAMLLNKIDLPPLPSFKFGDENNTQDLD
jgi:hypothetical protein